MRLIIALVFTLMLTRVPAQNGKISALTVGQVNTAYSAILKEDRTINIYLPATYDPARPYPVLYVLDGSMHEDFLHITGLVQFFNLQFNMPDCIVVGIANVDRKRDFTHHTAIKELKENYPTTGHSEAFIQYIEKELQPLVASYYKTNGTHYLIGQSLGGLLATEILLKKPALFTHYMIVSPSLWWDEGSLLRQAPALWAAQVSPPPFVYIAVGKGEHKIMRRDAKKLHKILKGKPKTGVNLYFNQMAKENHATILHQSIYDGLLLLFPYKGE